MKFCIVLSSSAGPTGTTTGRYLFLFLVITFLLLVIIASFIPLVVITFIPLAVVALLVLASITFILLVVKSGHLGRRELPIKGGHWSVARNRLAGLRTEETLIGGDGRVEREENAGGLRAICQDRVAEALGWLVWHQARVQDVGRGHNWNVAVARPAGIQLGGLLTLQKVAVLLVCWEARADSGVTLIAEMKGGVDVPLPRNRGVALVAKPKVAVFLVCQGNRVGRGIAVWAEDALLARRWEITLLANLKGPNVLARKRRSGKGDRAAKGDAARVR